MTRIASLRYRTLKNVHAVLSLSLFFAVSLVCSGGLLAAGHGRSTEAANRSGDQEGVRYVYVTMSPEKEALLEKLKRESCDLCGPKFTNLIEGKHPAVVRIDVEGGENVVYHGSGTLVEVTETTGLVLTNWHVIRDRCGEVRVRFPDGLVATATVVKTDATWDLAALSIARPNTQPVGLAQAIPEIGDTLTIAGYGGGTYRQSSGRLLQFCAPSMTEPEEILEVTTAARNGDSGGPIFAQDGTLAGVLFGSISGTTNGSHVGRVRSFLQPLIAATPADHDKAKSRPVSYATRADSKF